MLQFDGLASSTSLAAMSAITADSSTDEQSSNTGQPSTEPISTGQPISTDSYINHLETSLREALEQNSMLWSQLVNAASISQPTISRTIFTEIYPIGREILQRIIAMTQHLVLQDSNFLRRPGVKVSQHNREVIEAYANESITRITRGQTRKAPANQYSNYGL
jgi:hypothetical protein